MVPKHQGWISLVTKIVVQLVHCIVPNVPISHQTPRKSYIIISLRNTAPQNLSFFQVYTWLSKFSRFLRFTTTWKHPTWISYRDNNCWSGRYHQRKEWYDLQRRYAFMSTFVCRFWIWKDEAQSIQLSSGKSEQNSSERRAWSIFQHFRMCSQSGSGSWNYSEGNNLEDLGTFTHTKLLPCWTDGKLGAPGTTWQSWTIFSTKLTSSSRIVGKEWRESAGSTSWKK